MRTYDDANQLSEIRDTAVNGDLLSLQRFTYDADGRISGRIQLPLASNVTLPIAMASTYDSDNCLVTWNGSVVEYDDDGNMTRGPLASGDALATYTYDVRNRLAAAGGVSYGYDAENNRISMTTSAGVAHDLIDPHGGALPRLLLHENPAGGTTSYVYGIGLLYEVDDATDEATFYHFDQVGSTIALTNRSGDVTDWFGYTPYGSLTRHDGAFSTPFQFNGELGVQTDDNGLVYMRARYYNPRLMRFLNADPIKFDGGLNWYASFGNNPISNTDPSGLWFGVDDAVFAGGGALLGAGGKFVANLVTGTPTHWQDIVGAAVGGAAGGEALLYTANPFIAGAAGGAAGNLATLGLNLATGNAKQFSGTSLAVDTGLGTLTGFIPGASVAGVTAGRGSAAAVFEQIVTKAGNGTISQITTQTAFKMGAGAAVKFAVAEGSFFSAAYSNVISQSLQTDASGQVDLSLLSISASLNTSSRK